MRILKLHTVLIGLALLTLSCRPAQQAYLFTSFHEPATEGLRMLYSYDGYRWTDTNLVLFTPSVGGKIIRDPSMVQGPDGTFHLVWTSAWRGDLGFGYAQTKDLIHWTDEKFVPIMAHEPTTVNVWAPELFYDDENKQYVIIWASTIPFRFPRGEEEENNNHRMYYTTTKDFKAFEPAKLFLDPGFSVIDAVIVKRARKDYVLVLKDNTRPERDLKISFATSPLGPYTPASAPFTESFTEGPSVLKTGDTWLVYFDAYRLKRYGAVSTKDFKTFTDASDAVVVPEGHKHGTILTLPAKQLESLLGKQPAKK